MLCLLPLGLYALAHAALHLVYYIPSYLHSPYMDVANNYLRLSDVWAERGDKVRSLELESMGLEILAQLNGSLPAP